MAFQKCPTCLGNGTFGFWANGDSATCPTCLGARIIDEITGIPPEGAIPKTITSSGTVKFILGEDGILRDHNGKKIETSYTVN